MALVPTRHVHTMDAFCALRCFHDSVRILSTSVEAVEAHARAPIDEDEPNDTLYAKAVDDDAWFVAQLLFGIV